MNHCLLKTKNNYINLIQNVLKILSFIRKETYFFFLKLYHRCKRGFTIIKHKRDRATTIVRELLQNLQLIYKFMLFQNQLFSVIVTFANKDDAH